MSKTEETALIIGGGAAGMLASILLAERGYPVHVFEQNEKLGKKLFLTGKGRCNVTNACEDVEGLLKSVVSNPKFLYSAFNQCTNRQIMDFFERLNVPLKIERGGRVFPKSDKSSDVIRALERRMKQLDVKIHLNSRVEKLLLDNQQEHPHIQGVLLENGTKVNGGRVLVATGRRQRLCFCESGGTQSRNTSPVLGAASGTGRVCAAFAGIIFTEY